MTINKSILLFFFAFSQYVASSQQYLGIIGSNYAGTNAVYANPANMVDSRHKVFVNLGAADMFLGNNAVRWTAPYSFAKLTSGLVLKKPKEIWRSSYLEPIDNNREKNLNGLVDVRGPAIMYAIDSKQSIAITSRGRGALSATNVSPVLAKLIQYGPRNPTMIRDANNLSMSLNMNAFAEIGLSYGKDISLNSEEAIKVAVSVKRVIGLTNFHMIAKESAYQLSDNVPDPNGTSALFDNVLNLKYLNAKYGFSDEDLGLNDFNLSPDYWASNASPGRGYALDIGLVYESRPQIQKYAYKVKGKQRWDETQNKYDYKIGVSLIDIGRVNFNNPTYVSNYEVVTDNKNVFDNQIKLFPNRRLINSINTSLNVSASDNMNSFFSILPATFQAFFDYKVRENIYVYSTWVQNLRSVNKLGMRMPSLVSVVPRYESKWIDVAMPVSLLNDYLLLTLGISARFGPIFIGSDHLQGLFNIGNPRGFDLHMGANIPIYHKLPTLSNNCYYEKSENAFINFFKKRKKKSNKGLR